MPRSFSLLKKRSDTLQWQNKVKSFINLMTIIYLSYSLVNSWENNICNYSIKFFWVVCTYRFKFISNYSWWLKHNRRCSVISGNLERLRKTILVKDISICLSCPDDVPSCLERCFSWSFQSQQHLVDGNQDCHNNSCKTRRGQLESNRTQNYTAQCYCNTIWCVWQSKKHIFKRFTTIFTDIWSSFSGDNSGWLDYLFYSQGIQYCCFQQHPSFQSEILVV